MDIKIIKLVEYSEILFSRPLAKKVFDEKVEEHLGNNDIKLILNFEGVQTITHSFADEFFSILLSRIDRKDLKKRIAYANCSDFNKMIMGRVISSILLLSNNNTQ